MGFRSRGVGSSETNNNDGDNGHEKGPISFSRRPSHECDGRSFVGHGPGLEGIAHQFCNMLDRDLSSEPIV